jgi:hypothetical protein
MQKTFLVSLIVFAATSILGCSVASRPDYSMLGLVEITGIVSLDGTPLSGVEVRFQNREDGTYSFGRTDVSGRYSLMFDSDTPGIIPGKKQVILISGASNAEESSGGGSEGKELDDTTAKNSTGAVPTCYGVASKVEVDISKSDSKFDIDFKSDCSTKGR